MNRELQSRSFWERQQSPGTDGADTFLKLVKDPFKNSIIQQAFWASLATSIGFTVFIALLFSLLRPYNSIVYAPKLKHADDRHAPPPVGKGLFAWIKPILKTREVHLVEKVGMDATIFLRFTRMCRNVFLIMSVVGCAVMIPVNVASSVGSTSGQSKFLLMTPILVYGNAMWAHIICSYSFNLLIIYFLWTNYRAVVRLRRNYLESPDYQNSLHARTLMTTDIPPDLRSNEGLSRIIDGVKPVSSVSRCAIGRNTRDLPELIEEHDKAVKKLESYLAKYLKNPDSLPSNRPTCSPAKRDLTYSKGQKVDAIDYLTTRIRLLEGEISHSRDTVDNRNAMPYGFTSVDDIPEAHIVAFLARNKHPNGTTIKLAPKPNDIIWDNLPLSKGSRKMKRLRNNLWVALLTVVWIAPNSMMAIFLSNLSNLGLVWPAFRKELFAHPKTWAAVQGVASPAVTSLIYLILPIIFRRLSIRAGDTTKTSREKHVIHKLYAFFVFNNLLIFSLFSAIWAYVSTVIDNSKKENPWEAIRNGKLVETLFEAICTVSPFWVTWLLQRNLGAAIDLSQAWNLICTWFARTFMNPTPRQLIDWTAPPPFDYASYYNYFLFYATVALCFATLQPLVLPVTAFYFCLDSWLKKYLLMYVFVTKTESGGTFWRVIFNRIIFATIIANFVVALVVYARGKSPVLMAAVMIPAPLLMLAFKWYCRKTFDVQAYYYTTSKLKDPEGLAVPKTTRRDEKLGIRFGHPAFSKALMTPMVHAKAQHVLKHIYQGRLDSDTGRTATGNDIPMHQLSRGQARDPKGMNAPFEVVPEGQLDFSYYKNRDEFGEDHGGGELYGQPIDLISERSHTPVSHLGSSVYGSQSSRSSSPIGYGRRPVPRRVGTESTTYTSAPYPSNQEYAPGRSRNAPYHGDIGIQSSTYHERSESQSRLLSGASMMPTSTPGVRDDSGDRSYHRPGGVTRQGYNNVPQDPSEDPTSYDYFRHGRQ